ncbi:MAG: ATP-binding protein [Pseudomonadota bacterium]|nr:ATP-binding protein [Pseudomonadota bacterium]
MTATVFLLLILVAAAWVGGSYLGMRRATRAQSREFVAETSVRALMSEIEGLRADLAAEQMLLERLPDPVILFGPDRNIRRLNAEARSTLGTGASALLRMPAFRAALDQAMSSGTEASVDLALPVPVARELHMRVLPVGAGQAQLLALLSDRTRERAVERMRADFVANASHELRTPLASLIGFIETLRGPAADDPAAQHRFLGIMAEQGQRMNRLIDDLLGLSRIELTEHVAPSGRVDLTKLTETIAASLAPLFTARDVTLDCRVEPGLPSIIGDRDQLGQVLQNLIENAIKYGRDGGFIYVDARLVRRAGVDGIAVSVRDEGAGIPALHIPRLTERFYRVNTRRSRAVGGTGLGLAIVKHIVNRHRGQLRIESTEGEGTTVTVWLPTLREPDEPAGV